MIKELLTSYVNEELDIEDLEHNINNNRDYFNKYFKELKEPVYRGIAVVKNKDNHLLNENSKIKSYSKSLDNAIGFATRAYIGSAYDGYVFECTKGLYLDVNDILGNHKYMKENEVVVLVEEYNIKIHKSIGLIPKAKDLDIEEIYNNNKSLFYQ